MRVSCLILLLLAASSTRLYAQDAAQAPIARPERKILPREHPVLVQELPYCELGYGPCGGECTSEEGKKKWNCSAETLPCHHEGQSCTCEAADMCKVRKKPEHTP